MTHEQLLNKLYYEDLNFIGVNPLYTLAKKHDKTISKEFVSNWLKNQSTQQQTTKSIKKKQYKPIYSEDYYSYQIDLTFLNKYKNKNDGIQYMYCLQQKILIADMCMHIMVKTKKQQQN